LLRKIRGARLIIDDTTYHLEMIIPQDLRPKLVVNPGLSIEKAQVPSPEVNRYFYTAVGRDWHWEDRLSWSFLQWQEWVGRPELGTWIALISGNPAGYFELESQPQGDVEINSFGLLPDYTGQGLGGHLLTVAVKEAWEIGAKRVWLHTCSLDHPSALPNYLARGFKVFQETTTPQEVLEPDGPPENEGYS